MGDRPDTGHRGWRTLRERAKKSYDPVCCRCGRPIPMDLRYPDPLSWSLDHLDPVKFHGGGIPTLDRVRPAHLVCNSSHGSRLSGRRKPPAPAPASSPTPAPVPISFDGYPWMDELIDMMGPEDVWPRIMTAVHPDAVGTIGPEVVARIEARRAADPLVPAKEKQLRWFQKLLLYRAYEIDADGRLVWERVLFSSNRQVGKSIALSELALDRMIHGPAHFGEDQLVLHAARDLSVAEEVQRPARMWSRGQDDLKAREANGQVQIAGPNGRWLIRSERALYGFSVSLGILDEGWDVDPAAASAGLVKTAAAREQSQIWLVSTAHAKPTALVPSWRTKGLKELDDPGILLMIEWSAEPGCDPTDEDNWRAASPFFDGRRREVIAEDLHEPDFNEQWLNIWPPDETRDAHNIWLDLTGMEDTNPVPYGEIVAAIESDQSGSCAVAWSWRNGNEIHVGIEVSGSLEKAMAKAVSLSPRTILMHNSNIMRVENPPQGIPLVPVRRDHAIAATGTFRSLVKDKRLRWSGRALEYQMRDAVVAYRDGAVVVDQAKSRGPVNGLKVAVWATWSISTQDMVAAGVY